MVIELSENANGNIPLARYSLFIPFYNTLYLIDNADILHCHNKPAPYPDHKRPVCELLGSEYLMKYKGAPICRGSKFSCVDTRDLFKGDDFDISLLDESVDDMMDIAILPMLIW